MLEKLKWDLVSVIANDFLAHILHHLPLPKDKMELVKKHAQTFIALCATGGCQLLLELLVGKQGRVRWPLGCSQARWVSWGCSPAPWLSGELSACLHST